MKKREKYPIDVEIDRLTDSIINTLKNSIMGHIAEPKDVDFYVENRPLTKTEKKRISDFIQRDKDKRKRHYRQQPAKQIGRDVPA